jgi:hypothetical protein
MRGDLVTRGRGDADPALGHARHGGGVLLDDRGPVIGENLPHHRAKLRFGVGGEAADDRDVGTVTCEQLRLFHPHVAASEHHQGLRHLLLLHRGGGGEVLDGLDAVDAGDHRLRTGRDQVAPSAQWPAVDLEGVLAGEPCLSGQHRKSPGIGHVGVLVLLQATDQLRLLVHQSSEVDTVRGGGHAPEGVVHRALPDPGSGEQGLGRDTTDVHAGAAKRAPLDEGHAGVGLPSGDAGRHRGPAGTDHSEVDLSPTCPLGVAAAGAERGEWCCWFIPVGERDLRRQGSHGEEKLWTG